jgi:hypothetical protein
LAVYSKLCTETAGLEADITTTEQALFLEAEGRDKAPANPDVDIERAMRLISGESNVTVQTAAQQLPAKRERLAALKKGQAAQKERLDAVGDRLTAEANIAVQPAYHAALRNLLAKYKEVALASKALDEVTAGLTAAGYPILGHLLCQPHAVLQRFDETVFDSEISALP